MRPIAALEALHRDRPLDAGITNALGYTLADHKRELPRAEQLIREALDGAAGQSGAAGQPRLGAVPARSIRRRAPGAGAGVPPVARR